MLTGSVKLVWAVFQALFIGFVQTLGSDAWLRLDLPAKRERLSMMEIITRSIATNGTLSGNWTSLSYNPVQLTFSHIFDPTKPYDAFHYIGTGCYRNAGWSWVLRGPHWYQTLPLVPLFAFLLALWNAQTLASPLHRREMLVMVIFGCASFAANKAGATFVNGSFGNLAGAFSVSLLGNLYSRMFHGFAFGSMVPGVLLLVPTGLTAAGGLAQNYTKEGDQFANGLGTGLAMILVSIAISIGIGLATALVHGDRILWRRCRTSNKGVISAF